MRQTAMDETRETFGREAGRLASELERGARQYLSTSDSHSRRRNRIRLFLPAAAAIQTGVFFLILMDMTPPAPALRLAAACLLAGALLAAMLLEANTDYAQSSARLRLAAQMCERGLAKAKALLQDIEARRVDNEGAARGCNEAAELLADARRTAGREPGR